MQKLKEDRNYYMVFLIGLLPFGFIYGMLFQYDAINALNTACAPKEKDTTNQSVSYLIFFLLSAVTLGIYGLFWINQQGKRMSDVGDAYGIRGEFLDPDRQGINNIMISYIMIVLGPILLLIPILGLLLYPVLLIVALVLRVQAYNKFYCDLNVLCRAYNREAEGNPYIAQRPDALVDRGPHRPIEKPVLPPPTPAMAPPPQAPHIAPPPRRHDGPLTGEHPYIPEPLKKGGVLMATGQYAGSRIEMKQGENITIGRDPARCALICQSDKISRVHVNIQYKDGYYMVTDLSTNGTISSETGRLPKNLAVRQRSGTTLQLAQSSESVKLL